MQRTSAILLLVLLSFWLILPALNAGSADSTLPECCRKGGQHHCFMESDREPSEDAEGLALKSDGRRCPLFPRGGAVPACGHCIVPHAHRFFAVVVSRPAVQAQIEAQYRISFNRAWQQRGPPAFLS